MATYARIGADKLVAELFSPPPGVPIEDCFVPELIWINVSTQPEVQPGWIYNGAGFEAPPAPEG